MIIYSNFSRMFEGKKSKKINESILLFGDLGEKGKKISGRINSITRRYTRKYETEYSTMKPSAKVGANRLRNDEICLYRSWNVAWTNFSV